MALLSGEVETQERHSVTMPLDWFRMALLSGEVETGTDPKLPSFQHPGSGWLCYPGKLKPWRHGADPGQPDQCVPDGFSIRGS